MPETSKSAFSTVALIGAPNAGKSTLLNRLVGTKVAIVTHKAQTTRSTLTGISIRGHTQLAFIDTPGIFAPRKSLDMAMVSAAWRSLGRADIVALLVPALGRARRQSETILANLQQRRSNDHKYILVINKIDRVKKTELLTLVDTYTRMSGFDATFMISALDGNGVDDLHDWMVANAKPGAWTYDPDQLIDASSAFAASEITREKLLLRLHQELPYRLTVETEEWSDSPDGSVTIRQVIYVERVSHKKMVIGAGGQTIKQVGVLARKDIKALLGRSVNLLLRVKERSHWMDEAERFAAMGLEHPSG